MTRMRNVTRLACALLACAVALAGPSVPALGEVEADEWLVAGSDGAGGTGEGIRGNDGDGPSEWPGPEGSLGEGEQAQDGQDGEDSRQPGETEGEGEEQAAPSPPEPAVEPVVTASAHLQRLGWQGGVTGRDVTVGTCGQALRLEALALWLGGQGTSGSVEYKAHVQGVGWQSWTRDGGIVGSAGQRRRVEGVRVRLTGRIAETHSVWYRVHVQGIGWMGWARDGAAAGTTGYAKRVEALQVALAPRERQAPPDSPVASATSAAAYDGAAVQLRAHVQRVGWQGWAVQGGVAGTTGRGLRVEALQARVGVDEVAGGIEYRAHVQRLGWTGWSANGGTTGTTGRALRMEALEMRLTGELASRFDLYYRVHVQSIGWMAWAKAGELAGTYGLALRMEAVQTCLVEAGGARPSDADATFGLAGYASDASVAYEAGVQDVGWAGRVADGAVAGSTGRALALQNLRAWVSGGVAGLSGSVVYRAHVSHYGWQPWVADGSDAVGTEAAGTVEAVELYLTGQLASLYDIWYRAHVQSAGWLGWTRNGASAGSVGMGRRMEALEVRLVSRRGAAPGSTANPLLAQASYDRMNAAGGGRGVSGFGGYEPSGGVRAALEGAVGRVRSAGFDVGFIMMDVVTGKGVAANPDAIFYAASTIKGPYVASLCSAQPGVISAEEGAIRNVLTYSSNSDYTGLRGRYGRACIEAWCRTAKVRTDIATPNYPRYSARELGKLWCANYNYFASANGGRVGAWFQAPEVSPIRDAVAGRATTRTKAGWIGEAGYVATNDAGVVYHGSRPYVVAIMTNAPVRFDLVRGVAAALWSAHGEM